jgi:hypothetical protein
MKNRELNCCKTQIQMIAASSGNFEKVSSHEEQRASPDEVNRVGRVTFPPGYVLCN